jgi:hypothetical protein
MIDPEEAVTALLSDEGKPLVAGGVSGLGILRGESILVVNGEELYFQKTILGKASQLKALKFNDQLTLDGQIYRVQHDPFVSANVGFCRVPVTGPVAIPSSVATGYLTTTQGVRIVTARGANLTTARGFPNG